MFVSILLAFLTFFLLLKDLNPKIMEFRQPLREIIQYGVAGLILFLNIVNIYNSWDDNNNLIKTAKNTLTKIDSVYLNQVKSDSTLRISVDQIKKVDTVLGIVRDSIQFQVKQLDTAINKSKELTRLEALDFESKKAELSLFGTTIELLPKDSTKFKIVSTIKNLGRKAIIKYSHYSNFIVNTKSGEVKFIAGGDNPYDANLTTFEIESNMETNHRSSSMKYEELHRENAVLFYVYTLIYQDFVSKKIYKDVAYEKMILPYSKGNSSFIILKPEEVRIADNYLRKFDHYRFIYPPEHY